MGTVVVLVCCDTLGLSWRLGKFMPLCNLYGLWAVNHDLFNGIVYRFGKFQVMRDGAVIVKKKTRKFDHKNSLILILFFKREKQKHVLFRNSHFSFSLSLSISFSPLSSIFH